MKALVRVPDVPASWSRRLACSTLTVSLLTLAGCATPPPTDLQNWQGRFSVTMLAPPGAAASDAQEIREERAHGTFKLTRSRDTIKIEIFSPFGQTLASAHSSATGGAELTTSDGRHFVAADPDTLVEQAFGWRLPVSALPQWLDGSSLGPGTDYTTVQDWSVKADQRFDNGAPRRLTARWPASQRYGERRINLFLVVDRTS